MRPNVTVVLVAMLLVSGCKTSEPSTTERRSLSVRRIDEGGPDDAARCSYGLGNQCPLNADGPSGLCSRHQRN